MAHEFTVLDSELLLESPILALRRDTLAMPGDVTATREVVEHFGAVAVVALDDDGRIALVRQYRHSAQDRLWELPAGILDMVGEDELATAERELQEEAGLAAGDWSVLADLITSPGFCDESVRVYLARDLRPVERPEAEHEEADMTMEWVDLDEAKARVFRGEVVNAIAISGIMTAAEVAAGRAEPRPVSAPFRHRPTSLAERRQAAGIVPDMKKL
ncbi:NUDIX domain-containing protein [Corynebacterium halotolerans]|uniref:ADP-ribose pyrophosphatase n=1 Tax=Corynebacterium halotolerans YIM 70093 = DSM 44683 TaxID=1121362 RepID=M1MXA5_9CORY|nr:NUDIX hydrolase [Corynebacterium halotolerans]AGF72389.1 ADP-ribose pyrophosphatase [Corynebacterium halotolerans YIM 70093 = DSM 44683]